VPIQSYWWRQERKRGGAAQGGNEDEGKAEKELAGSNNAGAEPANDLVHGVLCRKDCVF
jgi:hypothetical protein